MSDSDIDLLHFDKLPEAKRIPDEHLVLGLDRQSGEPFGNPAGRPPDVVLCAAFDVVPILKRGEAVLFPLAWLYAEYPARSELWVAQCDALRRHAHENDLPFVEPWKRQGILK